MQFLFDRRHTVDQQTGRLRRLTAGGRMGRFCLVLEQACPLPPCRRRIGPYVQSDAWFGIDRVTPVISQALYGARTN